MFKEIDIEDYEMKPFDLIKNDWLVLSSGNDELGYNSMTINWGHVGSIWGKKTGRDTFLVYVRPQRYTHDLIEKTGKFTVSRLKPEFKKAHGVFGGKSGHNEDKVNASGLKPIIENESLYYEEANLVFDCEVIYKQDLKEENFVVKYIIEENYPNKDFHTMYVGKIIKIYNNE